MGYEQLVTITEEARDLRRQELAEGPTACHCGEPLIYKDGIRFCKSHSYQWPRDGWPY